MRNVRRKWKGIVAMVALLFSFIGSANAWEVTMTSDKGLNSVDTKEFTIGMTAGASDGKDAFDFDFLAPPPAPGGSNSANLVEGTRILLKDIRAVSKNETKWTLDTKVKTGESYTFTWNTSSLSPDETLEIYQSVGALEINPISGVLGRGDMKANSSFEAKSTAIYTIVYKNNSTVKLAQNIGAITGMRGTVAVDLGSLTKGDADFDLVATSDSGLAVSFSVPANNGIVSLSGTNNKTVKVLSAGSVTVTASQAGNANYNAATNKTVVLKVAGAATTVTLNDMTISYDGQTHSLTATSPDTTSFTYTYEGISGTTYAKSATAPKAAGTYTVIATTNDVNYSGTATATLTINKVAVTVNPVAATRMYNQPNPTFTQTYSGFVNNETKSVVSGEVAPTTSAVVSSNVGDYPITVNIASLTAANYTFIAGAANLTVTKATPVVTWTKPADIVYGTALSATQLNATFKDTQGAVAGTPTYTQVAGTVLNAGVDQELKVSFAPTSATNYNAPAEMMVKITVTKASLIATATSFTRHFTEGNPTLAVTYSGFVNGDDMSKLDTAAAVTTTAAVASPKGAYPITFSTAPVDANYTITTTDGMLTVTNMAPVVTNATTAREIAENTPNDTNVGAAMTATDGDSAIPTETLAWSLVDATGAFKINATTGQIMVADVTKLDHETLPSVAVKVTATDAAGAADTKDVTITIANVNEAPVATGTVQVPQKVITGRVTTFMVGATDVDGETLSTGLTVTTTGTITMNNPTTSTNSANATLTVNADGTCSFDAKDAAAGATYTFTYTVKDAGGLTSDKMVTLTLIDNEPPMVASTPAASTATIEEGATQQFSVTADDKNHSPQDDGIKSIVWKAEQKIGAGPWMAMGSPQSKTFTPAAGQSETDTFYFGTDRNSQTHANTIQYRVTVTVTDGADVSTEKMWMVTVTDKNTLPTVANAIADTSTAEDAAYTFAFPVAVFSDIDAEDATLITYSFTATTTATTSPQAWLSFDSATRRFSGTPNNEDVGTVTVVVTATDTAAGTVTDTFDIVVTNTNDMPVVANAIADQSATEDSPFTFTFGENTFTDVDSIHGDTLKYTTTVLPAWLTFNAATRTFSGTPLNGDVGTVTVDVTATDTAGGSITDAFVITVANTNDLPVITAVKVAPEAGQNLSKPTGLTKLTVNFVINDDDANDFMDTTGATFAGNDSITYEWTLTRKGQADSSLGTAAKTITFAKSTLQKGDKVTVTVTANDGEPGTTDVVAIKRITIGNPPWFPSVTPVADVKPLSSFNRATITSMTSSEVVAVVYFSGAEIKATDYLTAQWTPAYVANGHIGLRAGDFAAKIEAKQNDGSWMDTESKPIAITVDPFTTPVATDLATTTYSGGILTFNVTVGDDSQGYMVKYADQTASTRVNFSADAEGAIPTSKDVALTRAVSADGTYSATVTPFNPDGMGTPVTVNYTVANATVVTTPPSTTDWGLAPVGGTPAGDIVNTYTVASGTITVTLSWNKIPEATKYYVLVTDEAGDAISPELNRKLVTVGALDVSDKVSLDVALPAGIFGWYVIAANDNGLSAWSDADTTMASTQPAWFKVQGAAPVIAVPTFTGFTFSTTAMDEISLSGKFFTKYDYEVSFYNHSTGKKEMAEVHLDPNDPAGPELSTLTVKLPSEWSVDTKYSVQIRAEADGPNGVDVFSKWTSIQQNTSPVSLGGPVDVLAPPTITTTSINGTGKIEYVVYSIDPKVGVPVVVVPVTIAEGNIDISAVDVKTDHIIYVVARRVSGSKKSDWAEFAQLK